MITLFDIFRTADHAWYRDAASWNRPRARFYAIAFLTIASSASSRNSRIRLPFSAPVFRPGQGVFIFGSESENLRSVHSTTTGRRPMNSVRPSSQIFQFNLRQPHRLLCRTSFTVAPKPNWFHTMGNHFARHERTATNKRILNYQRRIPVAGCYATLRRNSGYRTFRSVSTVPAVRFTETSRGNGRSCQTRNHQFHR